MTPLVDKSNLMTDFSPYVLLRGADKSSYLYSYLGLATNIIAIREKTLGLILL